MLFDVLAYARPSRRVFRGSMCALMALGLVPPPSRAASEELPAFTLPGFTLTASSVREGTREAVALSETSLRSNDSGAERTRVLKPTAAGMPVLYASNLLLTVLYRQALAEAAADVRPDGALMAGKEWTGVWTRDVSYSTQLALAWVLPEAARRSLMAKTFHGRVRQDTGTGGAWPVSTDRVVWTLAAWELYLAGGDRPWLLTAYAHARRMAQEDWRVAHDPLSGLMRGESSFMDWREQTYPAWMEPVDIFQARALSTNVVHAEAYADLARMARELGRPPQEAWRWDERARIIRAGIRERLWDERAGLFRAFVYPEPDDTRSMQTEALGNSLAILTGVANAAEARRITTGYPVLPYGVPTIFPEQALPAQPYHNRAVWPFVESYWGLASAQAGNTAAFETALASVMRAAALFQTNKENFVFDTGRLEGTAVNSDRQLWSVAGFLALVYKGLFGLRADAEGFHFEPLVPAWIGSGLVLEGLRVHGATLDVKIVGTGSRLDGLELDGRKLPASTRLPYSLTGRHRITLRLSQGLVFNHQNTRLASTNSVAPPVPENLSMRWAVPGQVDLKWAAGDGPSALGAPTFLVLRDGKLITTTRAPFFRDHLPAAAIDKPHAYVVWAADARGLASAHSRANLTRPLDTHWAFRSATTDRWETPGTSRDFLLHVGAAGTYTLRVRYANGNGPINTDSKCALRSLYVDGRRLAALVLPQRGLNAWNEWGPSNAVGVALAAGDHQVHCAFDPEDRNMDEAVNAVSLSALEVFVARPTEVSAVAQ